MGEHGLPKPTTFPGSCLPDATVADAVRVVQTAVLITSEGAVFSTLQTLCSVFLLAHVAVAARTRHCATERIGGKGERTCQRKRGRAGAREGDGGRRRDRMRACVRACVRVGRGGNDVIMLMLCGRRVRARQAANRSMFSRALSCVSLPTPLTCTGHARLPQARHWFTGLTSSQVPFAVLAPHCFPGFAAHGLPCTAERVHVCACANQRKHMQRCGDASGGQRDPHAHALLRHTPCCLCSLASGQAARDSAVFWRRWPSRSVSCRQTL